jgi:hypothetical protein
MTNIMHKFFAMYLFLFITLYMFRARRAHHQKRQIVSIQPLVIILCWWPRCVHVGIEINRNKYIEKNLCITLVIYQESLHDLRSTKCKVSCNGLNKQIFCICHIVLYFIFLAIWDRINTFLLTVRE